MTERLHQNQIETSPELVRLLLESQKPDLAGLPIAERAFNGTDNAVYRLGEQYSVRLPIIDWAEGNEARRKPWLPWLRDRLSIDVPVPVYYGKPDGGYPYDWTIYPWFQGEVLAMGCDDPNVARQIAAFLAELRSLPTEGVPESGRSPHALDADVRKCLAQLTDEDRRDELIQIWNVMMETDPWDSQGALWMHGDVAPGNMIFQDGRLVAAIDWSGLGVGDPASDLQVAWNMLAGDARLAFREAMGVDDSTWERARARAFAQASFQLPYYRDTFPTLGNQAKYVFRQILEEMNP